MRELGLPSVRDRGFHIKTANGQLAEIREEVDLSFDLEGRRRRVSACLLPYLAMPCVVGVDFLCAFTIWISRRLRGVSPEERYHFESGEDRTYNALPELTPEQAENLREFLEKRVPAIAASPGFSTLTEYRIDVGQHPPLNSVVT